MIWDRWDDAMDDLDADRRDLDAEIEQLAAQLRALGVEVPPEPAARDSAKDHDEMYQESHLNVAARQRYRDKLRRLLEERR